jgi:hypothetical protein
MILVGIVFFTKYMKSSKILKAQNKECRTYMSLSFLYFNSIRRESRGGLRGFAPPSTNPSMKFVEYQNEQSKVTKK